MPVTAARPHWHSIVPTMHRGRWIGWGLVVQVVAVAGPLGWVAARTAKYVGVINRSTLLAMGQQVAHSHRGVEVLSAATVMFALGSVLVARPYVRSAITLVIAVPIAAALSLLLLGAIALIIAIVVGCALNGDLLLDIGPDPDQRRSTRARPP